MLLIKLQTFNTTQYNLLHSSKCLKWVVLLFTFSPVSIFDGMALIQNNKIVSNVSITHIKNSVNKSCNFYLFTKHLYIIRPCVFCYLDLYIIKFCYNFSFCSPFNSQIQIRICIIKIKHLKRFNRFQMMN